TAGHSVVLADLRTVTHGAAAQAWAKAREVIAARAGGTLGIILITDAAQAPLWVRATTQADASSNLTALHRYDNTGLRLWLNETRHPVPRRRIPRRPARRVRWMADVAQPRRRGLGRGVRRRRSRGAARLARSARQRPDVPQRTRRTRRRCAAGRMGLPCYRPG